MKRDYKDFRDLPNDYFVNIAAEIDDHGRSMDVAVKMIKGHLLDLNPKCLATKQSIKFVLGDNNYYISHKNKTINFKRNNKRGEIIYSFSPGSSIDELNAFLNKDLDANWISNLKSIIKTKREK